jgi:glycosyltransferase involved in cell wall biosynthesis
LEVSVIVPVYNEEKVIYQCLDALVNQDFPKNKYEIIVVNDGSTDNTAAVVEKFTSARLVNLDQNTGRVVARETGARNANYELLLLIDSRCIPSNDLLANLDRIAYQPVISGHIAGRANDTKYNSYERVLDLFRLRYYSSKAWTKEYWIDEHNFDRSPKGTTCLFISKRLFLESQPSEKGRHVNDDTRILKEVVKRKPILRHQDVKIEYHGRSDSMSALKHIFYRGPRFQDYYLCRGGIYHRYFTGSIIVGLASITIGIIFPRAWIYYSLALALGIFGAAFYLSKNVKDFFIVLLYLPLITITFITGILYGKARVLLSTLKNIKHRREAR